MDIIPLADIRAAAERIRPHVHRTPVMTCAAIDAQLPGNEDRVRRIFFKCENLQKVGAFKARGALNAVSCAIEENPGLADVVTHSSGNHAQAIALAGKLKGVRAHIVMPSSAPAVKQNAVRDTYKAKLYVCEPTLAAREAAAAEIIARTGAVLIHPFNNRWVQQGQGTCGMELMEQTADSPLDAVVIGVGGGGMFSGMASAVRQMNPKCRIFAAEPLGADDAKRSVAAGRILPHSAGKPNTIADGMLTTLGDTTFPILRHLAEDVITVSDAEIAAAMRLVMERMKIVVEPSACVPLAAALSPSFPHSDKSIRRIGVILTGGNIDLARIPEILSKAPSARM